MARAQEWYVRITSHSRGETSSTFGSKEKCSDWLAAKLKTMVADGERYMVEWSQAAADPDEATG